MPVPVIDSPRQGDTAAISAMKMNISLAGASPPAPPAGSGLTTLLPKQGDTLELSLRKVNGLLVQGAGGGGGVPEAPTDGQLYGRKSAAWSVIPSAAGYTGPGRKAGSFIDIWEHYTNFAANTPSQVNIYDSGTPVDYTAYLKAVTFRTSQYGAPPAGVTFQILLWINNSTWVPVTNFMDVSGIGSNPNNIVQATLLPAASTTAIQRVQAQGTLGAWGVQADVAVSSGAMVIVTEWGILS